jgi:hypothetical protein
MEQYPAQVPKVSEFCKMLVCICYRSEKWQKQKNRLFNLEKRLSCIAPKNDISRTLTFLRIGISDGYF